MPRGRPSGLPLFVQTRVSREAFEELLGHIPPGPIGGIALLELLPEAYSFLVQERFQNEKKLPLEERVSSSDEETFFCRLAMARHHIKENLILRFHAAFNQLLWEFHTLLERGELTRIDISRFTKHTNWYLSNFSEITIKDGRGRERKYDIQERMNEIAKAIIELHTIGLKSREITYERVIGALTLDKTEVAADADPVGAFKQWYKRNVGVALGYTWREFVSLIVQKWKEGKHKRGQEVKLFLPRKKRDNKSGVVDPKNWTVIQ